MQALKAEMRETADAQAVKQPLLDRIQELEQKSSNTARMELSLRAAKKAAGKADGQIQVDFHVPQDTCLTITSLSHQTFKFMWDLLDECP